LRVEQNRNIGVKPEGVTAREETGVLTAAPRAQARGRALLADELDSLL
jgi:hypothetical protein